MKKSFLAIFALLLLVGCGSQVDQTKSSPAQSTAPVSTQSVATATTNPITPASPKVNEKILTENDFNNYGLVSKDAKKDEDTFRIQINPNIPVYTFHVVSFNPNGTADEAPHIEVYKGDTSSEPLQKFTLDPNGFMADSLPVHFNAADINFDGFTDIGVVVDGGAKWGSYQYWIYDQKTGKFITAPVTEDFRRITSNGMTFDKERKQIIVGGLFGTGESRKLYQFKNGHLNILQDYLQENILVEDGKEETATPTIECHLTFKNYSGKTVKTRTEVIHRECSPKDFGFL